MSVDQPKIIDFIGVDRVSGEVILTISDHLEWSNSPEHDNCAALRSSIGSDIYVPLRAFC
jgi:hypothetical protein